MKNIFFYSNIASHYRKFLWQKLMQLEEANFHFYYGDAGKTGIKEIDFSTAVFEKYKNRIHKIKNYWAFDKIVIWQSGVISSCLKDKMQIAIFTGEMYCISTWLAGIICRLRRIKVVYFGHGIYGNENKMKLLIRILFYKIANYHLLYERHAKKIMNYYGFNKNRIYVVFNSLDYDKNKSLRNTISNINKSSVFTFFKNPMLPVLIFIGRLTNEKKIELLLSASEELNNNEIKFNVIIIGNGIEKNKLLKQGRNGIDQGWLHFTGAIYDEEILGQYIYYSDLCVSPGNVGLTAIHSLSYGTPICTHSNFKNQGPEVGSIIENFNGFLFEENSIENLKNKINDWFERNLNREIIRNQCYEIIDKYYNPYYQVKIYKQLIYNYPPEI